MITLMVCHAQAQYVSLLGAGLEIEPLSLKQSVDVHQAVTWRTWLWIRESEGGTAWCPQGKREQLLCTEWDESRASVCNFGEEKFINIFCNGFPGL